MSYSESLKKRAETARCGVYIPKGWHDLVNKLDADISALYSDYDLSQAKEKFGGLRFYIGGVPEVVREEVHELISKAQEESCRTCHECGAPANIMAKGGWYIPACKKHGS